MGCILRFIQHDESIGKCAATHVGERGDFDDATLDELQDLFFAHHIVHRVVQRGQVGQNFLLQLTWQKTERFACFDCRAGENNALNITRE